MTDRDGRPDFQSDLEAARLGDVGARTRMWRDSMEELSRIAAAAAERWHGRVSLSPHEVLNEAFLRLAGRDGVHDKGAGYFFTSFARECRRLLVDHWRHKRAAKRGGELDRVTVDSKLLATDQPLDLIDLHEAIEALERLDAREAQVADLRVFAGLTIVQIAESLGVSERTVQNDWSNARSWLQRQMTK